MVLPQILLTIALVGGAYQSYRRFKRGTPISNTSVIIRAVLLVLILGASAIFLVPLLASWLDTN